VPISQVYLICGQTTYLGGVHVTFDTPAALGRCGVCRVGYQCREGLMLLIRGVVVVYVVKSTSQLEKAVVILYERSFVLN
jgi:hypothetical protein